MLLFGQSCDRTLSLNWRGCLANHLLTFWHDNNRSELVLKYLIRLLCGPALSYKWWCRWEGHAGCYRTRGYTRSSCASGPLLILQEPVRINTQQPCHESHSGIVLWRNVHVIFFSGGSHAPLCGTEKWKNIGIQHLCHYIFHILLKRLFTRCWNLSKGTFAHPLEFFHTAHGWDGR